MKGDTDPPVVCVLRPGPSGQVAGSTAVGPVVAVLHDVEVHVVPVTGLAAADAAVTVHDAAGVGPVTTGAGQVIVIQLFAAEAVWGEHEGAG